MKKPFETMSTDKRLRTIKRAAQETGSSQSFFKQLLRSGTLTKYHVPGHRAVYVSMTQFDAIVVGNGVESTSLDLRPIKKWLQKGEIEQIAQEVGISTTQASNIISGKSINYDFVRKMMTRAEANKALYEKVKLDWPGFAGR